MWSQGYSIFKLVDQGFLLDFWVENFTTQMCHMCLWTSCFTRPCVASPPVTSPPCVYCNRSCCHSVEGRLTPPPSVVFVWKVSESSRKPPGKYVTIKSFVYLYHAIIDSRILILPTRVHPAWKTLIFLDVESTRWRAITGPDWQKVSLFHWAKATSSWEKINHLYRGCTSKDFFKIFLNYFDT